MAKEAHADLTQGTRYGTRRRGGSNIDDEQDYIQHTKRQFSDREALRDHARLHSAGTSKPCTPKGYCREYACWLVLDLLEFYETAAPFAAYLRELGALVAERGSSHRAAIPDQLNPSLTHDNVVLIAWGYFYSLPGAYRRAEALELAFRACDPFYEMLAKRPLDRFRELATVVLGLAGYSYQEVADFVDMGDADRTRKSRAWRYVLEEYARQGKRPPKKRPLRRYHRQPDTTSVAPPATPAVATAARAELATRRQPHSEAPQTPTPTRQGSEGRVKQVEHLVNEPSLD